MNSFLNVLVFIIGCFLSDTALSVLIPNSCVGLPDGTHWLKLIDDDYYPLVRVECSNEFMIIDVEKEPQLKEYFSSWDMWHYSIAGPVNDDPVNWDDWYLPSKYDIAPKKEEEGHHGSKSKLKSKSKTDAKAKTKEMASKFGDPGFSLEGGDTDSDTTTQYVISSDCSVCDKSDEDSFSSEGTYMSGNLYGCFWYVRGLHDCDMDWDTLECYYCVCDSDSCDPVSVSDVTDQEISAHASTGTCATIAKDVTFEVAPDHDTCTSDSGQTFKPSIGTDGRNCVCVQPSTPQYFEIEENDLPENFHSKIIGNVHEKTAEKDETEEESKSTIDHKYYLYQNDFIDGTYRITNAGTYILMEDIVFDFNRGNSNEDGAWLPHEDQVDDYPGAGQYRDPYFMGFFAGITVETSDVIIDLNGKTVRQSLEFYYQQRWFAHIELANQPFMPAQGPGMFGATVTAASNVEIKNGIFGLTAHHAIHGNRNENIKIHDIEIKDFETHGIQLNGFNNIELYNINIHSTSNIAYLKGEYGHARMLLPRLKKIYQEDVEANGGTEETFLKFPNRGYGRVITMKQIYEEIEEEINMAFDYALHGITYDNSDDLERKRAWGQTKKNFLYVGEDMDDLEKDAVSTNSQGLPYGTAVYGIFLSFPGANVFSYGSSNLKSYNAKLYNIQIHGLRHKMQEYLRFHQVIPFNVNPFNAVFDVNAAVSDLTDIDNSHYVGNIMTDAYIGMNRMTKNFGYLQMQNLDDGMLMKWAANDETLALSDTSLKCNSDVMTHSGKGIIGIRIDGVDNVEMENIEIYNMYDYTKLGSEVCGEYEYGHGTGGGHFLQKTPMQTGFSGNMMQGISLVNSNVALKDVNVHDIGSATGLAYGIAIWRDNEIELNGEIHNSNIKAGFQVDMNKLSFDNRPNKAPEACGVMTYWNSGDDTTTVTSSDYQSLNIVNECVSGHVGCFDSSSYGGSMLGTYENCQATSGSALTEQTVPEPYQSEIDIKLLGLKDNSNLLNDFNNNGNSIAFDESKSIFTVEKLDPQSTDEDEAEGEQRMIKVGSEKSKSNGKNNKAFYSINNLPQFFTGLAISVFTILGLIFAAMSYGMYKSFASSKKIKEREVLAQRAKKSKKDKYTSLSNVAEFDAASLGYGYGAC